MIVVVCSWVLTLAFVLYSLRARLRLVLVARACHELRGPLFAVQLGLHGLVGDPARLAAIELELARAGRALDDLAAAPHGRRVESRSECVDVAALLESYAPAWRTLAAGYGATLRLEPGLGASSPSPDRAASASLPRPATLPRAASSQPASLPRPASPPRAASSQPASLPRPASPPRAASSQAASLPRPASPPRAASSQAASLPRPASPPRAASSSRAALPARPALPPRASMPPTDRASPRGAVVSADPLRIAQACANLVGNAAEHGEGEVRVRVRAAAGVVRIEVADDGPGLPASVTTMTAYARARRSRRGHGLAIAAAIAADHGGRLFAAPSESGARLVFELPAVAQPPVAA